MYNQEVGTHATSSDRFEYDMQTRSQKIVKRGECERSWRLPWLKDHREKLKTKRKKNEGGLRSVWRLLPSPRVVYKRRVWIVRRFPRRSSNKTAVLETRQPALALLFIAAETRACSAWPFKAYPLCFFVAYEKARISRGT